MAPTIQDPVISRVFFDSDFVNVNDRDSSPSNDDDDDAWTHFSSDGNFKSQNNNNNWTFFQNNGNAFRSNDFQKAASFSPDSNTSKTWASSTFDECSFGDDDDDDQASSLSSPLHHPLNSRTRRSSPLEKKPLTRSDEERVQQLVQAIRKEYQDVNTEAGQQTMMSHLNRLQQQQQKYADSCFENHDLLQDPGAKSSVVTLAAKNQSNTIQYPTPRKTSRRKPAAAAAAAGFQQGETIDNSTHGPASATTSVAANRSDIMMMYSTPTKMDTLEPSPSTPKQEHPVEDPDFDPFAILPADSEDDDSTRKPISFLNTDANDQDAFSDDDTLTLSLYSEEEEEEELERAAERIHVLKESVLAILNCTLCTDPMALLTGNYEGCGRDNSHNDTIPNVSDEEVPLTVEQSIDLGHDEIHL